MSGSVLISSAGRRVALLEAFRASMLDLGIEGRVLAADVSRTAAAFHRADAGYVVPRCNAPEYLPELSDLCRRHEVALLVPTIDPELPVLAEARERFAEHGTVIAVSSPDTIRIGSDKRATHEWLSANGFPTVRQTSVSDALQRPDDWALPLIVKPARGSASIGVDVVRTRGALALHTESHDDVVQTIATGDEYTVDVFVATSGRVSCAVPRRRLETRGGEVSKAVTVNCQPLIELVTDLVDALPGAFGALNVQLFADFDRDEYAVIEINPRFGGGFPLSLEAGADFPRWLLEQVHGLPSSVDRAEWRTDLVMLRYDDAVFVDAEVADVDQ